LETLLRLIRDYNLVLYAVCLIAFAYFAITALSAMRDLRRATFKLERQTVAGRATGSWLRAVLCILAAFGVNVASGMAPAAPASATSPGIQPTRPASVVILPTSVPTANLSNTLSSRLTVTATLMAGKTVSVTTTLTGTVAPGTLTPRPTQTAAPATTTPIPTPTSAPVAAPAQGCGPDAQITDPQSGGVVRGKYVVRGTAVVENGGYYKLEVLVPGAQQWSFINRGEQSVQNNVLLQGFDFNGLQPGAYQFRLVVVKQSAVVGASCQIQIVVN